MVYVKSILCDDSKSIQRKPLVFYQIERAKFFMVVKHKKI